MNPSQADISPPSAFNFERCKRWEDSMVADCPSAVKVYRILQGELEKQVEALGLLASGWSTSAGFKAKGGEILMVPGPDGALEKVLLGMESYDDLWNYAALATKLPAGTYELADESSVPGTNVSDRAALGFLLGCYAFERYKSQASGSEKPKKAALVWPSKADRASVEAMASAFYLARDLINTPCEDLGPQHMVAEAQALASAHGASVMVIQGEELLEQNYPAIHTVGRASHRPPALIDMRWSPQPDASLPLLSLVGKGVCFDTGGLNLKQPAGMKTMKKDMGGGAMVLALAHVIMSHKLPVQLRVMVPTVENSVSANAYRPMDVLQTRAGITVENGNTDAEGRLILCDAMYEASTENPDLLIDCATLTGAARVALGSEVPAVFSTDEDVWNALWAASESEVDPLWRLPLFKGYRKHLDSKVADLSSISNEGSAGSIAAALYLREFVKDLPRWVHVDFAGWNYNSSVPGKPEGGEAMALRALWTFLKERYSSK